MTRKIMHNRAARLKGLGTVFLSRHCVNRCIERVFNANRTSCDILIRQAARDWLSKGIKRGKRADWYKNGKIVVYSSEHTAAVVVGDFIVILSRSQNDNYVATTMLKADSFGI